MTDVPLWSSARRAHLHLLCPSLLALTAIMIYLASQEVIKPGGHGDWGDVATGMILAFGVSLPLFIHQTLKGPLMETDEAVRRRRESRNMKLGLALYAIIYVAALVFLRNQLSTWRSPVTYGALAGSFMGMLIGIGGVWLFHHLRGTWPPDNEGN